MGIAHDDRFRIQSGIKFTLTYFAGEGNTFLPQEELCEKDRTDAGSAHAADRGQYCERMAFTGEIHVENLDNRTVVFLMSYYLAEQNVCKCLSMINDAGLKPVAGENRQLDPEDRTIHGDLSFGESETCGDQF